MKNEFPSLITANIQAGLALAGQLEDSLQSQIEQTDVKAKWLGDMNYLPPSSVPKEIIASILFYAIAAANQYLIHGRRNLFHEQKVIYRVCRP
jgi:hypothetical protein